MNNTIQYTVDQDGIALLTIDIPGMSMNERAAHTAIPYQGVVCVSLLLRRKLSDFYVTNIIDRSIPFTGVIEMSALVDPVEFGNRALVYLPKYVAPDDPMFDRDDASIVEEFFAALEVMHGDLEWGSHRGRLELRRPSGRSSVRVQPE